MVGTALAAPDRQAEVRVSANHARGGASGRKGTIRAGQLASLKGAPRGGKNKGCLIFSPPGSGILLKGKGLANNGLKDEPNANNPRIINTIDHEMGLF